MTDKIATIGEFVTFYQAVRVGIRLLRVCPVVSNAERRGVWVAG